MAEMEFTGLPWEVHEGAYSLRKDEWSVWENDARGNGDKRIACWIREEHVARLIAATPYLLAACKAYLYGEKDARECESMMWAAIAAAEPTKATT